MGIHFGRPVAPIIAGLRDRKILTGGSADPQIMRLMPPAYVTQAELDRFFEALDEVLDELKETQA